MAFNLLVFIYIYEMCMWPSPAGLYFLKSIQYVCVCIPSSWSRNHAQHLYLCSPSHTHTHVYTATSFSSDCSPSGRAPRIPGRRARAHGLPSSSRQPGTRPCFLYGSRTQRCPLRRAPPPPESWETDERKKITRTLRRTVIEEQLQAWKPRLCDECVFMLRQTDQFMINISQQH